MNLLTFSSYLLFCIFAPLNGQRTAIQSSPATAPNPMGINLAPYNDYSPEFLFKDVFKSCREWITFDPSNPSVWDTRQNIPLRPDGYPRQIPADGQAVRTLMLWDLPHGYPAGAYRLRSTGRGIIRASLRGVSGSAVTFNSPVNATFQTDGINGVIIEILESEAFNPVRNIQFEMPFNTAIGRSTPFNPRLIAFLKNFDCIRWMDLMRTNGSPISTWSQRTSTAFYSQAQATGVAYEYLIQLNNRVQKDAWVNIPHAADNNFIAQFATLLRDQLNPSLKIYVEYSNEVWNGIFPQHEYARAQGALLGYPGTPTDQTQRFYAKRSADVFAIFDSVFARNRNRLVKVLASHAVNIYGTEMVINAFRDPVYNPRQVQAHALAIAPYFGNQIGQEICNAGTAATISVNEVLDLLEQDLANVDTRIQAQKNLADANQLRLLAYEGGQHLINGSFACQNNADLTQKLNAANRDPRMEELYCRYLESWFNRQGGLFMHYNSYSTYNQHGSWGLKEYMGQPDASAHKYRAWMRVKTGSTCN